MAKKKVVIEFDQWTIAQGNSFEEMVTLAFRQVIPSKKIEVTKLFVLLYKCSVCQPFQRIIIGNHLELELLQNGMKEPFKLVVDIESELLV